MYLGADDEAEIIIGGDGMTPAQKKALDENTKARHTHDNKDILDELSAKQIETWNNKVDKIEGKGLSTNDYTNEDKEKLSELNNYDDTELRLRDERLKYYGDADIVPIGWDEEYKCCFPLSFSAMVLDDETKTAKLGVYEEDALFVIDQDMEELVVPYSIRYGDVDYLVTGIVNYGFYGDKFGPILWKLKKLILPSTIETIGMYAFGGTPLANQIDLRNCKSIGENAFSGTDETFAIKGYAGSAAEAYAKENGIDFVYVETDVDKKYVDNKIGDIETALDSIMAIQSELMGVSE